MAEMPFNVLLLGESEAGWASLHKQLQKRGCRCQFAHSPKEALATGGPHAFDLILSTMPVARIEPFVAELGDAQSNVFYCHPVEDGCWWLPVVRHGRQCFGAPGVRGGEFLAILDQMIRDGSSPTPTAPSSSTEPDLAPAVTAGRPARA